MWPKKKWRRHWNIKLNSGWSSGNSFNENQYTKTYTYIQIWCNHRESDREKVEPSFKSSNMISISRKNIFIFSVKSISPKKIHFFCEINFAKNTYLFFRLRLYMISWWCWFYMKECMCQKFLFLWRDFFSSNLTFSQISCEVITWFFQPS